MEHSLLLHQINDEEYGRDPRLTGTLLSGFDLIRSAGDVGLAELAFYGVACCHLFLQQAIGRGC